MKNKILNKLTIKWNKKENCFGWKYPCRQGDGLGYEISIFMNELMKDYNWKDFDFESVEICGLCTDICVISNALIIRANYPEIDITVDASCCAGVTPETHKAALETMKMCQIEVIGE